MIPMIPENTCPFLEGTICRIATQMVGCDAVANPSACRYCSLIETSRQINPVTVSLALTAAGSDRSRAEKVFFAYGHLIRRVSGVKNQRRLDRVVNGSGVGSHIWKLLGSIGVEHDSSCNCLEWAEKLNSWGVAGCKLAKVEIVEHLVNARKKYGWVRSIQAAAKAAIIAAGNAVTGKKMWLNPLDAFGSLVSEAIRRAELDEIKKAVDEFNPNDDAES